ncbi:RNA cap methyltransferase [Pseudozyma hubeiensis SY62]|uniref:mRNA cap guanine-N(7) methyltransferase n=1 Tax=Pseudozyma hubeiensis (strain SY62) TaxID=1305764 RepID=R9NXA8_PSEHS|nr:RNA cap methyltransferase [Pseudozyma hubeiensis SY62]GAC93177.1 RNA cap methyltransferase [Pseudozyma hubeiensis SY62]
MDCPSSLTGFFQSQKKPSAGFRTPREYNLTFAETWKNCREGFSQPRLRTACKESWDCAPFPRGASLRLTITLSSSPSLSDRHRHCPLLAYTGPDRYHAHRPRDCVVQLFAQRFAFWSQRWSTSVCSTPPFLLDPLQTFVARLELRIPFNPSKADLKAVIFVGEMPGYDPVRDAGGSDRPSPPPNHQPSYHPGHDFRPSPSASLNAHTASAYNENQNISRPGLSGNSLDKYGDTGSGHVRPSAQEGVPGTSFVSPRSSTIALPHHPQDYASHGEDSHTSSSRRYEHSPRNSLHSETPLRSARRSASIADLIAASELSEADHERHRQEHRESFRYQEDSTGDRSMSRSSSASGGFPGAPSSALPHGVSHPRFSHPAPLQSARSERSPSMAHLLNDGTAGAVVERPRSGSHSSVSSHVSHPQHQHHPSQVSPLGPPSGYAPPGSSSYPRDRHSTSHPVVGGSPGLYRVGSPSTAFPSGAHPPSISTLNRGGSSPGFAHTNSVHPAERARYATQPSPAGYAPPSRSASYAYPSTSSSPASHPHAHLQPSPSHRFAVPEVPFVRSPESRRVPLPHSPNLMPHAQPRSSSTHAPTSSWYADEHDAPSTAGMPPPPVQASPRRGSLANSSYQGQSYAHATPGHSVPPSPGGSAPHGGYPVTPGARSLPPRTPTSGYARMAGDGYDESNYFPRMDDRAPSVYDPTRERSGSLTSPYLQRVEHGGHNNPDFAPRADHERAYSTHSIRTPGSEFHADDLHHAGTHAPLALPPVAKSPSFGPQRRQKPDDHAERMAVNGRRDSGEHAHAHAPHYSEDRQAESNGARARLLEEQYGLEGSKSQDRSRRDSLGHERRDSSPAASASAEPGDTSTAVESSNALTAQRNDRKRPRDASVASNGSAQSTLETDHPAPVKVESSAESTDVHNQDNVEPVDVIAPLPRYAPTRRVSQPSQVMRPIGIEEIDRKRARCRNPLRREWEQAHKCDSREALDEILRDFHSKLAAHNAAKSASNGNDTNSTDAKKRAIGDTLEDAEEVADHYNKRREVGIHGREESPIIALRKFNNWIKSVLIGTFARGRDPSLDGRARARGGRILELGCGKGGDLKKWEKVRPSGLVGADIAAVSIEQAIARYRDNRHGFSGDFFAFDCFSMALTEVIPRELLQPMFDNVTLQFCMHYAWESVEKARMMLDNVARYLRKGGVFVGTIPDSRELRDRLAASAHPGDRSFGNRYYKVVFDQTERWPAFGNRYTFFLEDAVENVPEYVVDFEVFEDLAHEVGLRCIYRKNFAEIYEEGSRHPEHGKLLEKMRVVDRYGSLNLDEEMWQAATLYLGFAFEKM